MAVGFTNELTKKYKTNLYHIELEVTGWDTVTLQVLAPVVATLYIYGTLNNGMSHGQLYPTRNYGAELAIDWSAIQAVNLATGSAVNSISAAGLYAVPVNTPFIKVGGPGANVYGLFQFNSKIQ